MCVDFEKSFQKCCRHKSNVRKIAYRKIHHGQTTFSVRWFFWSWKLSQQKYKISQFFLKSTFRSGADLGFSRGGGFSKFFENFVDLLLGRRNWFLFVSQNSVKTLFWPFVCSACKFAVKKQVKKADQKFSRPCFSFYGLSAKNRYLKTLDKCLDALWKRLGPFYMHSISLDVC